MTVKKTVGPCDLSSLALPSFRCKKLGHHFFKVVSSGLEESDRIWRDTVVCHDYYMYALHEKTEEMAANLLGVLRVGIILK